MPPSLAFTDLLSPCFHSPYVLPRICIAIPLFSPRHLPTAARLSNWAQVGKVHGYTERAYEHVKDWMDALQILAGNVVVEVTVHRPWRDYRSLRGVTSLLRENEGKVEVRVAQRAWLRIPNPEFHVGLTVAALEGISMARQSSITADEAKELCDHGCRGFRG